MIEVLSAPDHVVALHASGSLTAQDYDAVIAEVEAKLSRHDKIGLFVDMTGFEDITAEGMFRDLRYGLGKIGEWRRFPREAIVTEKQWVKALVKVVDPLLPQVELRTFAPAERDQALVWASAIPGSPDRPMDSRLRGHS